MAQEEKNTNLDLNLKLSLPGLDPEDEPSNRIEISSSSSSSQQHSCMSLDINSIDSTNLIEVPSLVLMGCAHCLIYVMVSEVDPKCPKCKRTVLVDMFRRRPAKKARKINFSHPE
ncbi:unnamed protein product [Dovyalis caffra]|uniref:GIR1-like zinc ribbon domain-containing protein n=1 Tax=Dovyalis caffra TaxID=77055 RepID=A0AAV1QX26_9ROSI|nr:unnamed protein product [Dovyalis caffra]